MLYAFDGKSPTIAEGSYVSETATVIGDVSIGKGCYIGHGAIIRGDYGRIEIGDGTAVEEGVVIHAPPGETNRIGRLVTLGHSAVVHSSDIGDMAVIGMGAIVSIGAEVGEWAIVGEGSVVKMRQKIPPRVVVAGAPAKVVRELLERDEKMWTEGKQIYVDLAAKYLRIGMQRIERSEA